jgi:hypothetical protein
MRKTILFLILALQAAVIVPATPLTITTPVTLPPATQGVFYNQSLAALVKPTGGAPPYRYTLNKKGPVPPAWMKLSPKGTISGTPTAKGTVGFAFTVWDSSTVAQKATGSIAVNNAPIPAVVNYRTDVRSTNAR